MSRGRKCGIRGNHEIATRSQTGARREHKIDSLVETPPAEIDAACSLVIKLNKLPVTMPARRIDHELGNDNILFTGGIVAGISSA